MFDADVIDATALQDPWRRPVESCKCWLFALVLAFYPHEFNARTRKYVTILVFSLWVVIETGNAAGAFQATGLLTILRPAAFLILGQMWGIELVNLQAFGVEISQSNEDDSSDN